MRKNIRNEKIIELVIWTILVVPVLKYSQRIRNEKNLKPVIFIISVMENSSLCKVW